MNKRLYRSMNGRMLGGVCNGLAEYFDIDPTIVRLGWLITIFCWGGGLLAYLVAWVVIPQKPEIMP